MKFKNTYIIVIIKKQSIKYFLKSFYFNFVVIISGLLISLSFSAPITHGLWLYFYGNILLKSAAPGKSPAAMNPSSSSSSLKTERFQTFIFFLKKLFLGKMKSELQRRVWEILYHGNIFFLFS